MKTVLVTGVAGFIGSNLAKHLLDVGYRVVGVDNFDDTYDVNFKEAHIASFIDHKSFSLYRTDIRDLPAMKSIFETEKPNSVVHLAAREQAKNELP